MSELKKEITKTASITHWSATITSRISQNRMKLVSLGNGQSFTNSIWSKRSRIYFQSCSSQTE